MRAGKTEEARKEFTKAVDITHEHALELMRECRKIGVDCITAMFEADSQLAYLNKIGLAEFVISEDSDLILFGCKKVIFKLQLDGRGLLFDAEKLYMTINTTAEKFSFEKFRQICILSGCDYLDNLPGIGLQKARKFVMMTEETDMKKALLKIPSYLNMKKLEVSDEYIEDFLRAEATFMHMFVYNPLQRKMLRLNPIDDSDPMIEYCSNAGKLLEQSIAYQLALGNINPKTLERLDNFDPDKIPPSNRFRKHASIWKNHGNTLKTVQGNYLRHQASISSFFSSPNQKHKQLVEVQNIIEQENKVTSDVEIDDLITSYCVTDVSNSKRRNTELVQENENTPFEAKTDTPTSRNPFAKRHLIEPKKSAEKPSLLESLNSNEFKSAFEKIADNDLNHRIVSRFFVSKQTVGELQQVASDESDPDINKINRLVLERQMKQDKFYDAINCQKLERTNNDNNPHSHFSDDTIITTQGSQSSQEETNFVDVDKNQFKAKKLMKPLKSKFRGTGLFKSKAPSSQKSDDSSVQTKLSKFGFQKKSTFS